MRLRKTWIEKEIKALKAELVLIETGLEGLEYAPPDEPFIVKVTLNATAA